MKQLKWIIPSILILAIAAVLVWKYVINKDIHNVTNEKPAYTVTALALLKEWEANDTASTKKYLEKLVQITGTVTSISSGDSATVINLGDSTTESNIVCQIDTRNNAAATQVKLNTTVTIKGMVAGANSLGVIEGINLGNTIELKDGAIVGTIK